MAITKATSAWTSSADVTSGASISHSGSATAQAAIVLIAHGTTGADSVSSVTYGGVTMTRARSDGRTVTELGRAYIYYLDGCPRGTQNVVITHSTSTVRAAIMTLTTTTGNHIELHLVSGGNGAASNPGANITTTVANTFGAIAIFSGMNAMTNTPNGLSNQLVVAGATGTGSAIDQGTFGLGFANGSYSGTGSQTMGWSGGSGDQYAISTATFLETPVVPTAVTTGETFGSPWVGLTANATAISAPTLVGSYALSAQTSLTSTLNTTATIPAGSTILIHASSSQSGSDPYLVSDNSGEGVIYRYIRLQPGSGSFRQNLAAFIGFAARPIPSGTTFTVTHANTTTGSRLCHVMYVPGQVRVDTSAGAVLGSGTSWTITASGPSTAPGAIAIAVATATNSASLSSTDTSSPSMTELADTFVNHATSGDRAMVTQYKTDFPFSTTLTASGTWSASQSGGSAIAYTLRYWRNDYYGTVIAQYATPAHRWKLDETSGTVADDAISTSDGTYVNSPTLAQSGAFNGSDYSVLTTAASSQEITLPISMTGDFTIIGWVRSTVIDTLIARDHTNSSGTLMGLVASSYAARIQGTTLSASGSPQALADDQWHMFCLIRSGTTGYYLIDGQLYDTATVASTATASPWHLGKNGSTTPYETAYYDEWLHYTVALPLRQIVEIYDSALVQPWATVQAIPSLEAFGTPTINLNISLAILAIDSAEAFGNPVVDVTTKQILGIATAEAFGNPSKLGQSIYPLAKDSDEVFGELSIATGVQTLEPTAIDSAEAFGEPTLTLGVATVAPLAISSDEAVGSPQVSMLVYVAPLAINSAEAFGSPNLDQGAQDLFPTAISSAEAFGNPRLFRPLTIQPIGIVSQEGFGRPKLKLLKTVTIDGQAIASAEAFGLPFLGWRFAIVGIASQQAMGFPTIAYGPIYRDILGIASEESFTTELRLHYRIYMVGIASAESVNPIEGVGHVLDPSPQPGFFFSRRARRGYITYDHDGKVAS